MAVAIHVRVPIRSLPDDPERWVLAFNRSANYYIKVHLVEAGKPLPTEPIFEFNFFGPGWKSNDVQLHTEFEVPARAVGHLYVVYENLNGGLPMTIETVEGYASKRRYQDVLFLAVVGLTLGLVAITFFLMVTMRQFSMPGLSYAVWSLS